MCWIIHSHWHLLIDIYYFLKSDLFTYLNVCWKYADWVNMLYSYGQVRREVENRSLMLIFDFGFAYAKFNGMSQLYDCKHKSTLHKLKQLFHRQWKQTYLRGGWLSIPFFGNTSRNGTFFFATAFAADVDDDDIPNANSAWLSIILPILDFR